MVFNFLHHTLHKGFGPDIATLCHSREVLQEGLEDAGHVLRLAGVLLQHTQDSGGGLGAHLGSKGHLGNPESNIFNRPGVAGAVL